MVEKHLKKLCQDLISELKSREKEVIVRRFGLFGREKETLQSIGDSFSITRERVRQIENSAIKKIKPKIEKYKSVISSLVDYLKRSGGVKREEILLEELAGKMKNELAFIMEISGKFKKEKQDKDFYSFWSLGEDFTKRFKEKIDFLCQKFEKERKLKTFEELEKETKLEKETLRSYLEISKRIQKNEKGLYGLREWPEINPRGIGDRAYLIFKELNKPLHFREVAKLIPGSNVATIHNELIRDERFVLVGRGIYALREWGYFPGEVKDVILKILRDKGRPMTKEEILEEVKKQRLVKETTILVNLANKNYFERDEKGRYKIKTAQI